MVVTWTMGKTTVTTVSLLHFFCLEGLWHFWCRNHLVQRLGAPPELAVRWPCSSQLSAVGQCGRAFCHMVLASTFYGTSSNWSEWPEDFTARNGGWAACFSWKSWVESLKKNACERKKAVGKKSTNKEHLQTVPKQCLSGHCSECFFFTHQIWRPLKSLRVT